MRPSTYAGLCLLLTGGGATAEKVRFGPPQEASLQTRPERSMRELIELRSGMELNLPPPVTVPVGVPTATVATSIRSREDEADQQNWIFRDTRSATGVRKAFGVDSAETSMATAAERDSVAVIQDYFSRQKAASTELPSVQNSGGNPLGFDFAGTPGISGFTGAAAGLAEPGGQKSGNLFGESSFRNTLNSENSAVRRYFRELYATPNSSSSELNPASPQSANSPINLPQTAAPASASDATRSPSFRDLANRAAYIDSLTPATTLSPGFGPAPVVNPPDPSSGDAPTVNNGNLFERRNGRIEIPSRRF